MEHFPPSPSHPGGQSDYRNVMKEKMENSLYDDADIPEFVFPLFWEYDPGTIKIIKHADLIICRIMERGTWSSMLWLAETYPKEKLVSFLEKRGRRILPSRELNYWALVSGISIEKKEKWVKESREKADIWRARHAH